MGCVTEQRSPIVMILEDDPQRIRWFRSEYPMASFYTTAQGMIDALQNEERVDCLFLDHDLGGMQYVDPEKETNTGQAVVDWLVANKRDIGWVVVHTANHKAGMKMGYDLAKSGYCVWRSPFHRLRNGEVKVFPENISNPVGCTAIGNGIKKFFTAPLDTRLGTV